MFDSHCHLHDDALFADAKVVIDSARQAGVTKLLLAGVEQSGWSRQRALSEDYSGVYCALGWHPWMAAERGLDREQLGALEAALADGAIAVGEIGLDKSARYADRLAEQAQGFADQLDIAAARGLPVVLHVVRAHGEVLALLGKRASSGGIVHSFAGSTEIARRYLDLGFAISFSAAICSDRPQLQAVARFVPDDRLLVETDAPFQRPRSLGQQRYEPRHLPVVIEKLAKLRNSPVAWIAQTTAANSIKTLRIRSS